MWCTLCSLVWVGVAWYGLYQMSHVLVGCGLFVVKGEMVECNFVCVRGCVKV